MSAFICEDCTKVAEREYWNKVTNYQFFKITLGDFEQQLRIPKKFVDSFNGKLSGWRVLKGPSGNRWVVNLKRTSNDTFFSDGWEKFVIDHGIKMGHVLVFNYDGASEFKVTIFDGTSCEVESSHFVININPSSTTTSSPSLSSCYPCSSALHGIVSYGLESDIEECIHVVDVVDNGNDDKCYGMEDEYENGMHGDDNGKDDDYDYDFDYDEENEDDDDDDYCDDEEEYDRKRKRGRGCKMGTSSVQQRKQRHIDYKSNRRQVTIHEKERTKQMALEYLMRNERNGPPMFQLTMLPTHVYSGFHLTIPKVWASKHMYDMSHCVELRVSGVASRWLVGCRWSRGRQCQFIKGWAKFVLDHNLEEHDVCVFELLKPWKNQCNGYPLFQVHVFRVVEQPVPFTLTRRNL